MTKLEIVKAFAEISAKAPSGSILRLPPKGWRVIDYRIPKAGEKFVDIDGIVCTCMGGFSWWFVIVEPSTIKVPRFVPMLDSDGRQIKRVPRAGECILVGGQILLAFGTSTAYVGDGSVTYPIYKREEIEIPE